MTRVARARWYLGALIVRDCLAVLWAARFRYRAQCRPLAVGLVLFLARFVVDGAPIARVAVVCLAVTVVVVFWLRRKLTRAAEWAYAGTCLTAVITGLLLTATLGTGQRWLNAAALLTWAALALPWWLHHQIRLGTPPDESSFVTRWNTYVRDSRSGVMTGAELVEGPTPFAHGDTYVLRLVPYQQTLRKALADLPNWTTALDTPYDRLVVEQHPDHPDRPTLLRLQHVTRSPIADTVYYDQPRYDGGRIMLGLHADGVGEASLRLYTRNRMHSTFLIGDTGSGKSRLIETIAVSASAMRDAGQHTVVWYADGQDGASSPFLFQHSDWAVGPDGFLRMLSALGRVAAYRNKQNRLHRWAGFTPGPDRPGILVIMDEVSNLIHLAPERLTKAVAGWAKLGICFLAADQDSGLGVWRIDKLRTNLLAGNGIVMRVSSRIAGNLVPGLDIDPADLPVLPGYGVFLAARNSDQRTTGFRGRYSPDAEDAADAAARGARLPVPLIGEWFQRYPALELDPGAARAAGEDYLTRRETAERERLALRREIEGGEGDGGQGTGEAGEVFALNEGGPARSLFNLGGALAGSGPIRRPSPSMRERILALDWAGHRGVMDAAQMMEELRAGGGVNPSTVTKARAKLVRDGTLIQVGRGRYRNPGPRVTPIA